MNQNRRTLTSALIAPSLSPEARAIIEAGAPVPQTPAVLLPTPKAPEAPAVVKVDTVSVEPARPKVLRERPVSTPAVSAVAYVPFTVRVPSSIPEALLKASLERKIKKSKPYTQQDIVTQALRDWLQKNNYLSDSQ